MRLLPQLTSANEPLDMAADKFGALLDSSTFAAEPEVLRERIAWDGYLFMPGVLDRAEVLEARRDIV